MILLFIKHRYERNGGIVSSRIKDYYFVILKNKNINIALAKTKSKQRADAT